MTTYTPVQMDIPTGLDEVGYRVGVRRLPHETPGSYRMRLLGYSRDPATPDEAWFRRSLSNLLGQLSINVLDIDLELDVNGDPVATDPRIEISANKMYLWDDYGNDSLVLECDLLGAERYLVDLKAAIDGLGANFTTGSLDSDYDYYLSKHLRVSNTDGWVQGELLTRTKVHKLQHPYTVDIFPSFASIFNNEEATLGDVDEMGDYYIDRRNGVINNYEPMAGVVSYSYWDFPFRVWHDPVRVVSPNDTDFDELTQQLVRGELGQDEPGGAPNDFGASYYNELLGVFPLEWGE